MHHADSKAGRVIHVELNACQKKLKPRYKTSSSILSGQVQNSAYARSNETSSVRPEFKSHINDTGCFEEMGWSDNTTGHSRRSNSREPRSPPKSSLLRSLPVHAWSESYDSHNVVSTELSRTKKLLIENQTTIAQLYKLYHSALEQLRQVSYVRQHVALDPHSSRSPLSDLLEKREMEIQFLEHELFCAREKLKNSPGLNPVSEPPSYDPDNEPSQQLTVPRDHDADFSKYLTASAPRGDEDPGPSLALSSAVQCAAALLDRVCDERRQLRELASDARAQLEAHAARAAAESAGLRAEAGRLAAEAGRLAAMERALFEQDAERRRESIRREEALAWLRAELAARDAELVHLRGYCEAVTLAADTGPPPAFRTPEELAILQRALTRSEAEAAALRRQLSSCERRGEEAAGARSPQPETTVGRDKRAAWAASAAAVAARELVMRAAERGRRAWAAGALRAWRWAWSQGRVLAAHERAIREEEGEVTPFCPCVRAHRVRLFRSSVQRICGGGGNGGTRVGPGPRHIRS